MFLTILIKGTVNLNEDLLKNAAISALNYILNTSYDSFA